MCRPTADVSRVLRSTENYRARSQALDPAPRRSCHGASADNLQRHDDHRMRREQISRVLFAESNKPIDARFRLTDQARECVRRRSRNGIEWKQQQQIREESQRFRRARRRRQKCTARHVRDAQPHHCLHQQCSDKKRAPISASMLASVTFANKTSNIRLSSASQVTLFRSGPMEFRSAEPYYRHRRQRRANARQTPTRCRRACKTFV